MKNFHEKLQKSIGIISRATRCSIKSSPVGADEITIYNRIHYTMNNLKKVSIINNFLIKDIKITNDNFLIVNRSGEYVPGELFCDSDGKINGIVVSTNNSNQTFSFLRNIFSPSRVVIIEAMVNLIEHENFLQIHVEENCM